MHLNLQGMYSIANPRWISSTKASRNRYYPITLNFDIYLLGIFLRTLSISVRLETGDHFLLCLPINARDALRIVLHHTACTPQRLNNGGEQCSITWKSYYCFHVTVDLCTNHQEIARGRGMSQSQFYMMSHNKSGGFCIDLDDIPGQPGQNLFIKWYDIINCPHEVM